MKIIGIIGLGNMGMAICERLYSKYQFFVSDKDKNKTCNLAGVKHAIDNAYLIKAVETAILAVKPQDFEELIKEIKDLSGNKLLISIAAGITTQYLEARLKGSRVIRMMPNLPAKIGKGLICISKGISANEDDLIFSQELFSELGRTMLLNEDMLDAATAVSGSGPGYLYDLCEGKDIDSIDKFAKEVFLPSLISAAFDIGFTLEEARILSEVTVEGSIAFLRSSSLSVNELRDMVVSKGGTTEAALEVLHKGGTLAEAVKTAKERAGELSRRY